MSESQAGRRTPVPLPARLDHRSSGAFLLRPDTPVAAPEECASEVAWLRGALGAATGCRFPEVAAGGDGRTPGIVVRIETGPDAGSGAGRDAGLGTGPDTGLDTDLGTGFNTDLNAGLGPEGYRLDVRRDGIDIVGGDRAGVFRAFQTLRQLMDPAAFRRAPVRSGPWRVPAVRVADRPRYAWRGVLLDVARHFLPKADVLRFLDLMAVHHLNVLHLHLTDDQGWRVEVPSRPKLTAVGAWRTESMVGTRHAPRHDGRPHGGYYTRDDLREIVAYAAVRHITVVPEVDLPGHAQAVLAAYPELAAGPAPEGVRTGWGISDAVLGATDEALAFCREVLDEVCAVFPSRHICIGGDEVPRGPWRADPASVARARELGLPDTDGLQQWFTAQLADMLAAHGRTVFGWDEILEDGAPEGALIGGWRGDHGVRAAARLGFDVIASPDTSVYLDYRQAEGPDEPLPVGTLVTTRDVRAFDPVPADLTADEARHVVGGQAPLWSEHLDSVRAVDYAAFPRLCAFAEALWSGGACDTGEFMARLERDHLPRLDALGVEYRPPGGPHPWQTRPDAPGFPRERADREAELVRMTERLRENLPRKAHS